MATIEINKDFEKIIKDKIENINPQVREISLDIHENWEIGLKELHAHNILTKYLESQGFKVTRHAYGLDTAFIAEYCQGEGRRIGVCAEYDANPGLGHGCGHNLICITGVATALAIKAVLESKKVSGKVVLFGTPSEENFVGKIILTNKRAFQDNVDVCIMAHPTAIDLQYPLFLACNDVHVEFFGKASHAAASPWEGINALDAVIQVWNNISMLRQQILPTDRIHGIITDGGKAPNVIPEHASAYFYVRAIKAKQTVDLMKKLDNIFEAAALSTGCEVKYQWREIGITKDLIQNRPMANFYAKQMEKQGIVFPPEASQPAVSGGSTDMGNVSYEMPVIHPCYSIHTKAANHTVEFAKAAKTIEAHQDALRVSCCLAETAVTVLSNNEFSALVFKDFKHSMSNQTT